MRLQYVILSSFKKTFKFIMIITFLSIFATESMYFYNNFLVKKEKIYSFLNQATLDSELNNNWYSLPKNIQAFYETIDSNKDAVIYELDVYRNEALLFRSNLHNSQYVKLEKNTILLPGGSTVNIHILMNIPNAIIIILKPFLIITLVSIIILLIFLKHLSAIIASALNPLADLVDSFNKGVSDSVFNDKSKGIVEFELLKEKIIEYNFKREENEKLKIKNEVSDRILKISMQVSHDIRSPLAALRMAFSETDSMPEDYRVLISNSIQRINDISNNLLIENKTKITALVPESILNIIDSLILEKRMEFRESHELIFETNFEIDRKISALINKVEFQRVLSNLINNSIEAMSNKGVIAISTTKGKNEDVIIRISDSGRGMPKHVLERLGERGYSYGKDQSNNSGTGLGIYHAKSTIQSFNGIFNIDSIEGVGTNIVITLPIFKSMKDDKNEISGDGEKEYFDCVFIDDDELMRISWERKAKKKNLKIITMSSIEEFSANANKINKKLTQVYIDSDLGANKMRGEDFAKMLHEEGYEQLFIASGYEPEQFTHLPWLKYSGKECPF